MKATHAIAFVLVIIGALNWGLTAFGWNVVHLILGSVSWLESLVYILVGLSGLYLIFTHKRDCKMCESKAPQASQATM
ncbi:MAG: DUF378 domain-containing protein [Patescibacteria group bacterium]|nr:DUF378 domain-containing protein [Patescibacteria group bacterium]MDE2116325.1 DUF378 domain-containing protein [Patescibacteria group bacterium]